HGAQAPLSFGQEELWLREHCDPNIQPLYNECIQLDIRGEIRPEALERSLNAIIQRHEIWRTTFHIRCGQPAQVVHTDFHLELPLVDLRDISDIERRLPTAVRLVTEEVQAPFDLGSAPPLRARIFRIRDGEYRLFIVAHLLILDGVSVYQILPFELAANY